MDISAVLLCFLVLSISAKEIGDAKKMNVNDQKNKDRNERRRRAYAEMSKETKDAILKRRREQYALKKASEGIGLEQDAVQKAVLNTHLSNQNTSSEITPSNEHTLFTEDSENNMLGSTGHVNIQDGVSVNVTETVNRSKYAAYIPDNFYPCYKNSTSAISTNVTEITRNAQGIRDDSPWVLPSCSVCIHCSAKKFYFEPPPFCCSNGEVALVLTTMPDVLVHLCTNNDSESRDFKRLIRSYNNNLAYTTFTAHTDENLLKNNKGIYTFKVQGKIYHYLPGITPTDFEPRGLQLYFYDGNYQVEKRLEIYSAFKKSIMQKLLSVLVDNPYTSFLKQVKEMDSFDDDLICLVQNPAMDQRVYNLPTTNDVSAIISVDDKYKFNQQCHIQIYSRNIGPHIISHNYACYDPLQYPLLFPRGECGWYYGIEKILQPNKKRRTFFCQGLLDDAATTVTSADDLLAHEQQVQSEGQRKRNIVSCREYYCYKLQIRDEDRSMLLHTGRLLQQYVVDMYVKIETSRLDFHRNRQKRTRTELLQGIIDSIGNGCTRGSEIGKKTILPPSFSGGPRDMRKRYLDVMALVQKYGKPDFFITMTCNPSWPEISQYLLPDELPQNRPDLLCRVFRAKLESLKQRILKEKILGDVSVCVYSIEFQKRGLPHAHMLLIMKKDSKPLNAKAYDQIISAELPCPRNIPLLHSLVVKHMMHGPCGILNPKRPCMRDEHCKNKFPKHFNEYTTHGSDGYPFYRREFML